MKAANKWESQAKARAHAQARSTVTCLALALIKRHLTKHPFILGLHSNSTHPHLQLAASIENWAVNKSFFTPKLVALYVHFPFIVVKRIWPLKLRNNIQNIYKWNCFYSKHIQVVRLRLTLSRLHLRCIFSRCTMLTANCNFITMFRVNKMFYD